MDEKTEEKSGPQSLLEAWMKTSTDFWKSMTRSATAPPQTAAAPGSADAMSRRGTLDTWRSSVKTWQSFSSLAIEPESLEGMFKGVNALPDIMVKMMQPAWNGFFSLQQEWLKAAGRAGRSAAAYNFENLDQEAFKAFTDLYEKEFRQYLNVPALGLTRVYQERLNQAADRFNIFQAAISEFVSMLYLPVEKSMKVMQEELTSMADRGSLPQTSKDYYRMWVKTLEGHYMTLFKSSEYNEALGKTLKTLSEFVVARREILQDALQALPVPTQKDMDELYKEIYLLKKRVKELEKKNRPPIY